MKAADADGKEAIRPTIHRARATRFYTADGDVADPR
jgi:hypothetical protein